LSRLRLQILGGQIGSRNSNLLSVDRNLRVTILRATRSEKQDRESAVGNSKFQFDCILKHGGFSPWLMTEFSEDKLVWKAPSSRE
jgi:hypothetical protein